ARHVGASPRTLRVLGIPPFLPCARGDRSCCGCLRNFERRTPERRSRPLWAVVGDLLSGGRYLPLASADFFRARGDTRRTLLVRWCRRLREAVGWSPPAARPADQVSFSPLTWWARDVVPLVVRLV